MTELITERFVTEERGGGVHDATVMVQHEQAPGGEGDPLKEQDILLARHIYVYLKTRFPVGYDWRVAADLRQGIVKFSIPLLMGVCDFYVVNLRKCPDLATAVLHGAGEILERYQLSRSIFSQAALLDARAQHSKLLNPHNVIPG